MTLPDGPKRLLPLLNTLEWVLDPFTTLERRAQRYGDSFRVQRSGPDYVYFSSPSALQTIFSAPSDQLACGGTGQILMPLLGDRSVMVLEGAEHRQRRRLLMPAFHGERMRAYGQVITQITQAHLAAWHPGHRFAVRSLTQQISFQVILEAVFGVELGERAERLQQLLPQLLQMLNSPLAALAILQKGLQRDLPFSPIRSFNRLKYQIDQLLYQEIRERRHHLDPNQTDILTLLISAEDEAGQGLRDQELRDELITLLVAGHETTANSMAWALYWITALPEVRSRLQAEFATLGSSADPDQIARLPYLQAICQETLRIYPVVLIGFPRRVLRPIQIETYTLPVGVDVLPCIYLAHRRSEVYPQPDQFRPERFLERQFSIYEYLPFGGGQRRCIGMAFALFEMKQMIYTILSNWDLQLVDPHPPRPVRRSLLAAPPDTLQLQVGERIVFS